MNVCWCCTCFSRPSFVAMLLIIPCSRKEHFLGKKSTPRPCTDSGCANEYHCNQRYTSSAFVISCPTSFHGVRATVYPNDLTRFILN